MLTNTDFVLIKYSDTSFIKDKVNSNGSWLYKKLCCFTFFYTSTTRGFFFFFFFASLFEDVHLGYGKAGVLLFFLPDSMTL